MVSGTVLWATAGVTSAHADTGIVCGPKKTFAISGYCVWVEKRGATYYSGVNIESKSSSTAATGCKVTLWLTLSNEQPWGEWTSPKTTQDCTEALRKNTIYKYFGGATQTSADVKNAEMCIDLYWNNSSHSGAQICDTSIGIN
jgi:hypothetical protein